MADCDRPVRAKGLCQRHYKLEFKRERNWSKGDPEKRKIAFRERTRKRHAIIRGSEIGEVPVSAIGDRHGWICGICSEPVDPALAYPDRMMATIDHIIPFGSGGEHTYENMQLAHLKCNISKG